MNLRHSSLRALLTGLLLLALPWLLRPAPALAEPDIFASPVHGGCYLATRYQCKMHVEPFTITVASGARLVHFQLMATRISDGASTVIYDFRPDLANPVPLTGNTFTPSLVAKDFAATCDESYTINLLGQDSYDINLYNLGQTGVFTCPQGEFRVFLPAIRSNAAR